jgi:hypothetical protein
MMQNILMGPYNGFSPEQTLLNYKYGIDSNDRELLRRGWNFGSTNSINGYGRIITPFRAVNNSGDFLSRQSYNCNSPNVRPSLMRPGYRSILGSNISSCDGTGVPEANCNVKFVNDASDYTKFRKERAINRGYNKLKNGGYGSDNNQSVIRAIHRY